MTGKLLSLFTIVLLMVTAYLIWISRGPETSQQEPADVVEMEQSEASEPAKQVETGEALIGGEFTLTNSKGEKVSSNDFRGKQMLVFFGFTHCPDVCPVTLSTLSNVMDQLGAHASQVVPVLISVDPVRDTPERLEEYLRDFHPSVIGLTGSREEIKQVADAYKVYYAKAETETGVEMDAPADHSKHAEMDHSAHAGDGEQKAHEHAPAAENYLVNHSPYIYLMNKNGKYLTHFTPKTAEKEMVETIRKALTQ